MNCFDKIKHEILLESVSFKEARAFIQKYSDEIYYVELGYKILDDCYLIGVKPLALGIKGFNLMIQFDSSYCQTSFVDFCWYGQGQTRDQTASRKREISIQEK
jgi:hypothetical protein